MTQAKPTPLHLAVEETGGEGPLSVPVTGDGVSKLPVLWDFYHLLLEGTSGLSGPSFPILTQAKTSTTLRALPRSLQNGA